MALAVCTPAYVLGGKDPGGYVNEGVQIAQRGALVAADPVIAAVPAEFRDSRPPLAQHADLLRLALHGLLRARPAGGHRARAVPALPAGVDRDRLWARRAERGAPHHALLDPARPRHGVHPRRTALRPHRRRGGDRPPRHQRHRGVVQRLPERRGRGADAAVRGDAGLVAGAGRRTAVLRPGRRLAARDAAVPARRHGDRAQQLVGAAALGRMAGLAPVVGFFPMLTIWLAAAVSTSCG